MNLRLVVVCMLAWAGTALAGGWDTGSFDNDDALDWIYELSESEDLSVVESALENAVDASGYLEAPTGSAAIAAAEVVAALRGKPRSELPTEVTDWVRTHQFAVGSDLVETARSAISAVRNSESSELAQLWSDSKELTDAWEADLRDLLKRLEQ